MYLDALAIVSTMYDAYALYGMNNDQTSTWKISLFSLHPTSTRESDTKTKRFTPFLTHSLTTRHCSALLALPRIAYCGEF
jgi:hypothetical protein